METLTKTKSRTKILAATIFFAVAAAMALATSSMNTTTQTTSRGATSVNTISTNAGGGGGSPDSPGLYTQDDFIGAPPVVDTRIIDIAAGGHNACAVKIDKTVWCWGFANAAAGVNPAGYIGNSVVNPNQIWQQNGQPLTDVKQIVDLDPGYGFCALKNDGTVWCWGTKPQQTIGNDTIQWWNVPETYKNWLASQIMLSANVPLSNVSKLSGGWITCALKNDTSVSCWGDPKVTLSNVAFYMRTPFAAPDPLFGMYPMPIRNEALNAPLKGVYDMAGGEHVLCLLSNLNNIKKTWCIGYGQLGGLGNGSLDSSNKIVEVLDPGIANTPFRNLKSIHGQAQSAICGVDALERLACWGGRVSEYDDFRMQWVEDIFPKFLSTPSYLKNKNNQIITGAVMNTNSNGLAKYSCVLLKDGSVWCWGKNHEGQLGDGTLVDSLTTAVPVVYNGLPITGMTKLATGFNFSCVLWQNNTVACWGSNINGELGNAVDYKIVRNSPTLQIVKF